MSPVFLALFQKDLRIFFNDRRAVIMSFVAPIVIGAFFGYIFGGLGAQAPTAGLRVLLADADQSAISKDIAGRLHSQYNLDVQPAGAAEARESVRKGKTAVAVLIPQGFGEKAARAMFTGAGKPELDVLYDPSRATEKAMIEGVLSGSVMQAVSKEVFAGTTGGNVIDNQISQVEASPGLPPEQKKVLSSLLRNVQSLRAGGGGGGGPALSMPGEIKSEAVTARQGVRYNGYAHSFGGMGVQFILLTGIDVGIGMLLLRQRGLWKRFRAAPVSKAMLLGSRMASATAISVIVLVTIFTVARILFGVRIEGSVAGFLLVVVAFSLMTAAFGLMIAGLGKTPEATRGLASFLTLIMVMLGGAWVPTFIFPEWLQKITIVIPTRWAIDGLDGVVWRGLGFSGALAPAGVLLGFAVVFGAVAVKRFRWEAE